MGSREIQVTVYECDNPECKDQKTLPEGEVYPGLEGGVDISRHKSYDDKAWTACSEACLTPAILAVRELWMAEGKKK